MQMEDDEIEAEAADEQEDSSGPRKSIGVHFLYFIKSFSHNDLIENQIVD